MSHEKAISRQNPALIVFLLDQSGSMVDNFGGNTLNLRKADGLADAINKILSNLVIRCSRGETIRNYFDIAIIGYGSNSGVDYLLKSDDENKKIINIQELANKPLRIETRKMKTSDGAGGILETDIKFPIWFEPVAEDGTPMCLALEKASEIINEWIGNFPNSYPPILINISDGQPTDGDPLPIAERIKGIRTSDGDVLLFNCHLSSTQAMPILYPDNVEIIPDDYGKKMFQMSSILPNKIYKFALAEGFSVTEKSRGFVFQANLVDLIKFLDIGTKREGNQLESGNLR